MRLVIGVVTFGILALIDNAPRIIGIGAVAMFALIIALPAFS